jgi:CBS domain-containing protein
MDEPNASPEVHPSLSVADVMNRRPVTIREDADLLTAAELVALTEANDLMVVDSAGHLVGVLAEGDILRRALPDRQDVESYGGSLDAAYALFLRRGRTMGEQPIAPLVIRAPVLVQPGDHVAKIAVLMVERHIRTLAVVEGGRLVGSVSRADLCRAVVAGR